jgi:hypothetical protein
MLATPAPLTRLVGQWRLISFDIEFQKTAERIPAWGPNPKGRLVILPSSFMMAVLTAANRPLATTDELRASALKTMIAYSGGVQFEEDQMKINVDVSWDEGWTNTVQVRRFKFLGANLSLISDWGTLPHDPAVVCRGILEWEREA